MVVGATGAGNVVGGAAGTVVGVDVLVVEEVGGTVVVDTAAGGTPTSAAGVEDEALVE